MESVGLHAQAESSVSDQVVVLAMQSIFTLLVVVVRSHAAPGRLLCTMLADVHCMSRRPGARVVVVIHYVRVSAHVFLAYTVRTQRILLRLAATV